MICFFLKIFERKYIYICIAQQTEKHMCRLIGLCWHCWPVPVFRQMPDKNAVINSKSFIIISSIRYHQSWDRI